MFSYIRKFFIAKNLRMFFFSPTFAKSINNLILIYYGKKMGMHSMWLRA